MDKLFLITGTKHGSHIFASSEGEARKIFHMFYNGESIIIVVKKSILETLIYLADGC